MENNTTQFKSNEALEVLSGEGSLSCIKPFMVRQLEMIDPQSKNELLSKLDLFLPVLEEANHALPQGLNSAVEILAAEVPQEHDEEFKNEESDDEDMNSGIVQMEVAMFPVFDGEENDAVEPDKLRNPGLKKAKVVEEIDSELDDDL